jgi:tetratricopeptide (TPR) repeat protein
LLAKEEQYEAAIDDFSKAIELDPNEAAEYNNRAYYSRLRGQFDAAVKDWHMAISIKPNSSFYHRSIAELQASCPDEVYRDGKQALEHATKACELTNWNDSLCLSALAATNAESGDFENAVKWAEKSVEIAPNSEIHDAAERLELYRSNKPYRENAWKRSE